MEKINSKLSICIAAYNRPNLLRETLISISNLSVSLSIYVVDDCSPRGNEIAQVVESWASTYLGPVYFERNSANIGEVETKRKLFQLVKTEFLVLLGDDDTLVKDNFDLIVNRFEESKVHFDIELFGYNIINSYNQILKTRYSLFSFTSDALKVIHRRYFMRFVTFPFYYFHPALYIIRTSTAKELDLDSSIGIGEDYDLFVRIVNSSNIKWRINPIVAFNWRKHNNESRNQSSDVAKRFHTKSMIQRKHAGTVKRFWFLEVPFWFDSGYTMDKEKVTQYGFSDLHQKISSSRIINYGVNVIRPAYSFYKFFEYLWIQILFFFYGRYNRSSF